MQAMIMIVPPTSETMESILATRPRRTAPSRFPCSRLFLDWGRRSKRLLASAWLKRINSKNQTHTHTQILLSPWWSRQIQQCWWARLGRSRPARRGGGSLWLWSGPMVGWWRCWSGEKATAWARRRCSRWSSPCSPSWSCRDEGKRWSAAFWEERRRLERCSSPRTLSGSRYLRVKDEEDKEVKRQCSHASRALPGVHPRAGIWLSPSELTKQLPDPASLPTRCLAMRSNSSHSPFFSFSLMTMTSSPLDLLRAGLVPAGLLLQLWMSSSPLTGRHSSETGAWLDREPSWSRSDGCSSTGQRPGAGIMFTAMLTEREARVRGPVLHVCSYTWGQKVVLNTFINKNCSFPSA